MSTLDEIQERADKATEGPWEVEKYYYASPFYERVRVTSATDDDDFNTANEVLPADAEFIAHAREDVPKLAGVIRSVEATMDALDVARAEGTIQTYGQIQRAVRDAIREALI